jgi:hypothetical protein
MPHDPNYTKLLSSRRQLRLSSASAVSPEKKQPTQTVSIAAQVELAACFKRRIGLEQELNAARRALAKRSDFSLHKLIDIFNNTGDGKSSGAAGAAASPVGKVSIAAFRRFLQRHGVFAADNELTSLLVRYDRQNRGCISYMDLMEEIVVPAELMH